MPKIKDIYCREIFGPQGEPAIETTVVLDDGSAGAAIVNANEYDSKYAAANLTGREKNVIHGRGTLIAVEKIQNIIAPKLIGMDGQNQQDVDAALFELDGTPDKSRFGANATLSISVALVKAGAKCSRLALYKYLRQFIKGDNLKVKIPTLVLSLINGGRVTGNMLDFKDFLVIPASFKTFQESLLIAYNLQKKLIDDLEHKQIPPLLSMDGGFAISLPDNESALSLLTQAIEASNIRLGFDVFLGIDANANNFYRNEKYHLKDTSMPLSSDDLIEYYSGLMDKHQILYLEDPMMQDDWDGWEKISGRISSDKLIAGDMLTATNPNRLQMAINKKAISGIVIKPIQAGTITESLLTAEIARISGVKIITATQNGGMMDDFLADFSVAVGADYVNFGPLTRGDYILNYNRLLTIEPLIERG